MQLFLNKTVIETGFERRVFDDPNAIIELRDPAMKLSLSEVYRDVEFETET